MNSTGFSLVDALTPGGALRQRDLAACVDVLINGGLVITPSDTAYALSGLPLAEGVVTTINSILDRGAEPNSLAFGSLVLVERWSHLNLTARRLLEALTPGPLTLVVEAADSLGDDTLASVLGDEARHLGVRLPDSAVERQLSIEVMQPLTTAAIRDRNGAACRSFDEAVDRVRAGIAESGARVRRVVAVPTGVFPYSLHSTVVRCGRDGHQMLRRGAINEADIEKAATSMAYFEVSDWT